MHEPDPSWSAVMALMLAQLATIETPERAPRGKQVQNRPCRHQLNLRKIYILPAIDGHQSKESLLKQVAKPQKANLANNKTF